MCVRLTALAVGVAALSMVQTTVAADRLTLDDAFSRVASIHPELLIFEARGQILAAERDAAGLRPPLSAGLQLENALGTGGFSGLQAAEVTLTLASVLEGGGKLDARRTLAQARFDAMAVERETRRLDLLAEVARRYLALSAAEHQRTIATADTEQRRRTVAAARLRLQAGASPESVLLTAQAGLARAEMAGARAVQQWINARLQLAALWGEREPRFEIVATDPLLLPAVADSAKLAELLEGTPELARFAGQHRIAEARLRLARSSARPDLNWQVGVRRLQAGDDMALVAGFSLPLGAASRATPEIRAATAAMTEQSMEREVAALSLYVTLTDAHGRFSLAQLELQRLRDEVLPALARAESAAERAYQAGASSYLDWAQLQTELTATRYQQLEIAIEAQGALIEMQRLTGQPFVTRAATAQGDVP
ncbi:MAG: TolC family protein [Steroidobacteraceae bacterium]